jgi:YegS/Rv2252/BmrU family lipid kinase
VTRSFVLLANPASKNGKALKVLPAVHAALDGLGAPHRTVTTRSTDHAGEEAAKAAAAGDTVLALGGDGLMRPIAGAIKGTEAALAIVPCGRGNDFARVLGVPKAPGDAARLAVEGVERLVDVATVDGTPYVCIASLGFDTDVNHVANKVKLVQGSAVYLYSALKALAAWKPATFTVIVDGERREFTGFSVAVGNSTTYGGGMVMVPDAELDDGKLDVVMVAHASKLTCLRRFPSLFKGTHVDAPEVSVARGEEIHVDCDRPFEVYADGDPIGATPATMRVERRCLRVIVPAATA